jgi:hypothetical protein
VIVAVITKPSKGIDPDYPFKRQGRRAGDYLDGMDQPRALDLGLKRGSEAGRNALSVQARFSVHARFRVYPARQQETGRMDHSHDRYNEWENLIEMSGGS